jgi:hypothetical protein
VCLGQWSVPRMCFETLFDYLTKLTSANRYLAISTARSSYHPRFSPPESFVWRMSATSLPASPRHVIELTYSSTEPVDVSVDKPVNCDLFVSHNKTLPRLPLFLACIIHLKSLD